MLFIDLDHGYKNADVVEGVTGTNRYISMLYDDFTVHGNFLYLEKETFTSTEGQQAILTDNGILVRGLSEPAPYDHLLIFVRTGDKLVLLERLSPDDHFDGYSVAIKWIDNIEYLSSNFELIRPATQTELSHRIQFIGG